MTLQPVRRRTLADQVFHQITREIVGGTMAPGRPLPSERELADVLGVSRGAVREALKRLSQTGLVSIRHGGTTRVLDYRASAGLDLLAQLLLRDDGSVDLEAGRSILEMRSVLAPDIARRCAGRASAAVRAGLSEVVEEMAARRDELERLQTLALRFFELLALGSGNVAYQLAFNTLRRAYDPLRPVLVQVMAEELRALEDYRSAAEAVARGDGEAAAAAVARLVERGAARLLRVLSALERFEAAAARA